MNPATLMVALFIFSAASFTYMALYNLANYFGWIDGEYYGG